MCKNYIITHKIFYKVLCIFEIQRNDKFLFFILNKLTDYFLELNSEKLPFKSTFDTINDNLFIIF